MKTINLVEITPEELSDLIEKSIKKELKDLKKHFEPKTPTEYLTRNEVSDMLKIDLSSVHNWTKKRILKSYQIGGRIYYKRSEIESAIVELKK